MMHPPIHVRVLILLCTIVMREQRLTMNPMMLSTIRLASRIETFLIPPVASLIIVTMHVLVILRRLAIIMMVVLPIIIMMVVLPIIIMMVVLPLHTVAILQVLAILTDTIIMTTAIMIADIHPTSTILKARVYAATIVGTMGTMGTGKGTVTADIFLSCTLCF
jgi:hypothetical protein